MDFKPKDYVFARWEGEENAHKPLLLYKIVGINSPGKLECRLEKNPHLVRGSETVSVDRIVANLGPKPYPGIVYGHDLAARYRKTVETDYAQLHVYSSLTKSRLKEMVEAFNRVGRRLEKLNLAGIFSRNVDYFLMPKKGKYAGYFVASRDTSKAPHRMVFHVDANVESLDYLYLHEIAHAFHFECLVTTPEILVRWQRLYDKTVLPSEVSKSEAIKLFGKWQRSSSGDDLLTIGEFSRTLEEEEEKKQLRAVVRWIAQNWGVKTKELDLLMLHGETDELTKLWPSRTISAKRDIRPAISEYACTNVAETVAEAISFYLLKKKLPKEATSLVEASLSLIKADLKN